MIQRLCFSLLELLFLVTVFVILALEPVWNYLKGGGTRLKTCNLPPFWANGKGSGMRHPIFGFVRLNKIYDRSSGNRPAVKIGLPFQAGAMQSPSGQFA